MKQFNTHIRRACVRACVATNIFDNVRYEKRLRYLSRSSVRTLGQKHNAALPPSHVFPPLHYAPRVLRVCDLGIGERQSGAFQPLLSPNPRLMRVGWVGFGGRKLKRKNITNRFWDHRAGLCL